MPSSNLVVGAEGRKALATLIRNGNAPLYMGIGNLTTTTPWTEADTPVNFPSSAIKLENELVRQRADLVQYITPDVTGDIIAEDGTTYSISTTPNNILLARFLFNPPASLQTIYQYAVFMNVTPMMTKAAMTFDVNNAAGYTAGATKIQIDNLAGGTISDLLPVSSPRPGYGRSVTINGQTRRIVGVDAASQIITLDAGITGALLNNASLSTPSLTGVPVGQKQLLPAEVFNIGDLFLGRNVSPITRQPGSRTQIDVVFTV